MGRSVTLKIFTISILGLLLLIPSSMVKSVIHERQYLSQQANQEVQSKWARGQVVQSIILTVPVSYEIEVDEKVKEIETEYHFLPDELDIRAEVTPETLRRGIYEIVVYNSLISVSGNLTIPEDFNRSKYSKIDWDGAFVTLGISDVRGIQNDIKLQWNSDEFKSVPGSRINRIVQTGLSFPLKSLDDKLEHKFSIQIDLQGSEQLYFSPFGKTTTVAMQSTWPDPSFMGAFLPDERSVTDQGFNADWKVLQINRNFPQHWQGATQESKIHTGEFGVQLIKPSDAYQKSIRSIKYALMNIALTFLIFFVVEVMTKTRFHPLQYIMVGLSIVLFYILLISISEHFGFDKAYLVSAIAVIAMIFMYSLSVFRSKKFSTYLLSLISLNFGFIYITLQLQDYALLLGAVVMTVILALVMYTTRNVDWYRLGETGD